MLDIRELLNLKEAYAEVYASQELTEEQVWEEVETWVNSLLEEGYDLSDYTWEEMYESYLEEAPMTAFQAAGGNAKLAQSNKGLSPRSGLRATAQSIEKQGQDNLFRAGGGNAAIAKGPTTSRNVRGGGSVRVPTTTRQDVINRGTVAAAKPATPTKPATPAAARPAASTPARPAATSPAASRPAAAAPRPTATAAAPKPAAAPAAKPAGSAMDQFAKANPKLAAASAERARTRGTSATTNPLMKDMKSRLPAPKTPSPTTAKTGFDLAKKGVNLAAGFDMFDVVKGYLIGEGYADTEESALAIMINMSEEWRQNIMEISQKTATRAYAQSATGEVEGADDESDIKRTDRLRGHIERKFGKKAGEDADRHADSSTFGRKDPRTGKSQPRPQSRFQNPNKYRTTKDGKMHGQDQNKLKAKLERSRAQKESFNVFVNSMIAEGVSMERYTWEEIQNVFDDLFEAQVANRDPDEYERKAKQGQSREQQLKSKVMGRMDQMDPEKRKKMLAQMRAVGLDV